MRHMRFCRLGLAVGLAALAIFAGAPHAGAQDPSKIDVVPNISHAGIVLSVAFSPDGTRLLSGAEDKTLKLWDAASGQLIRTIEGHSDWVLSVAFSPDGKSLLSGSGDKTIKLWNAATGQLIRTFESHREEVASIAFSPDGMFVLSGSGTYQSQDDNTLKLWDAASGKLIRTFQGHGSGVTSVAFSPDGTRLVSGSYDKTLKLWDRASGQLIRTFKDHSGGVLSVAFSPDGTRLLSGSNDTTLKLWDVVSGQVLRTMAGHSHVVRSVAFSSHGTRLLSGSYDKTLKLWDSASGQLIRTYEGHSDEISSVAFSPDGRRLVSSSWDNTLKLWNAASGQPIRTYEAHSGWVHSVAFSPNGMHLLSASATYQGKHDNTLKLWDAASGQLIRTLTGHAGAVYSIAFSPDGMRVVSGSKDKTARLWDVRSGQLIRTIQAHGNQVVAVAFSPDGSSLLSASVDPQSQDSDTLKLWDAASGQLIRTYEWRSPPVSFDGKRLLSGNRWGDTLEMLDAATGQLIGGFSGPAYSVAFSPDGMRLLAGGEDKTLKLWDTATGQLIRTHSGHSDPVWRVAFSPDGKRLLSGSLDTTLKLWDASSGRLVHTFEGHTGPVFAVAFSPDAKQVLSGSRDGTVRIWSTATGELLATLVGSRESEWLSMTPAGFFASSGQGTEMLGVVRGLEVTTMGQVHQSLFNPDLVREALAGDPSGEVREAAKVINLEKVLDSGPAPMVAITSPAEGSQSAGDLATVTARIEDRGKGIGRIEWRVNGITAAVAAKPPGSGPAATVTQQLALDPGDNIVEVVAYNASNLLASLPARTTVKFTGPADKTKPKLHILAVGINAYVDREWAPPLSLAVKDAVTFSASMKKAAAGLYGEVRVTLALDKQATRDNLEKIVRKVAREIHPRDSFILFAAGHGTAENGRFYFIPQDYQSGLGDLAQTAIGQDRLQDWLANRIKARRAIILLDTCESGALVAGHARSRVDAPASEAAVGRLHEATGRPLLTAAAAGQFAHEGLIGASGERHGVFTWAVLDALRKGDSNGNGTIELSELVRHVQSVVPKIAAEMGGAGRAATSEPVWGQQAARFGSRGEDFAVAQRLQ